MNPRNHVNVGPGFPPKIRALLIGDMWRPIVKYILQTGTCSWRCAPFRVAFLLLKVKESANIDFFGKFQVEVNKFGL